ncbi:MAG: hypothetical protein R3F59_35455 [Myxococcota bacterium]
MRLPPGPQRLRLRTHDGAHEHDWPVVVRPDAPNAFCWDFAAGAPCSSP